MSLIDFSLEFLESAILSKLNKKERQNFRAVSQAACKITDEAARALFFHPPSPRFSNQAIDLNCVLSRCPHIKKLGFSGFDQTTEKVLIFFLLQLKDHYPKELHALRFENMSFENKESELNFFTGVSSPQIVKITYIQTNRTVGQHAISDELQSLFKANKQLETLHIEINCHQPLGHIPFSFCKNLKKMKHKGSDEMNKATFKELSLCEKLTEVYLKKEKSSTISNLREIFEKEIAKRITHLEIHLVAKDANPPSFLTNTFCNLQFLNLSHQYRLTNQELLEISQNSKKLKTAILNIQLISKKAFAEFILEMPQLEKIALTLKGKSTPFLEITMTCASLLALKLKGGFIEKESLIALHEHKKLKYLKIKDLKTDFNEGEYEEFLASSKKLTFFQVQNFYRNKGIKVTDFSYPKTMPKKAFSKI